METNTDLKVTIKDVAIKAGLSLGTTSKVLNGDKSVKESNRRAVEEAARALNYSVNKVARSLAHKPIKIGVLLGSEFEEAVTCDILKGIRKAIARLSDYKVSAIYQTYTGYNNETVHDYLDQFEQENVSGIVMGPSYVAKHTNRIANLQSKGIPVVVVISELKNVGRLASVRVDATMSGKMVAELSRMVLRGEESVAVIAGSQDITEHKEKVKGFCERSKELGIPLAGIYEDFSQEDRAYQITANLLKNEKQLRIIYVATANSTSVCKCIHDLGKENEVHVVATDISPHLKPFILDGTVIATFDQHLEEQGEAAINVLYRYLTEGVLDEEETKIQPSLLLPSGIIEKMQYEKG